MTKNISMEILSKAFKPIDLEINQYKNRHTNYINWTFLHVRLINIPIQRTQSKFVPSEKHSKNVSPSIQTLIDELKNVVFAKVDLEYQDNSTLVELLPQLVNEDPKSDVKDNLHDV